MATINDKLTYIEETKGLIKQAIIAKGVSVADSDTFRSYADKIGSIETGGGTTFLEEAKFGYSKWSTIPNELIPYLESTSDMSYMFSNCSSLTTVPQFNTSNVKNMERMFYYCSSLTTLPLFDTSNVTNMSYMFYHCSSLTTLPLFDTINVTNMSSMFENCSSLTTVPQFNTSNVKNMNNMFYYCSSLTTLPLFDTSNVTNMSGMFFLCSSLKTLGGFTGLKIDLNLSYPSKITVDSVMNIINEAADMTNSPKTLTLHANVYAKLNEQQIATATAKGWNIAEN